MKALPKSSSHLQYDLQISSPLANSEREEKTRPAPSLQFRDVPTEDASLKVQKFGANPALLGALPPAPGSAVPVLTKSFLDAWVRAGSSKEENAQRQAIAKIVMPNLLSSIFRPRGITIRDHSLVEHLPQGLDCENTPLDLINLTSLRDIGFYTKARHLNVVGCPAAAGDRSQVPSVGLCQKLCWPPERLQSWRKPTYCKLQRPAGNQDCP